MGDSSSKKYNRLNSRKLSLGLVGYFVPFQDDLLTQFPQLLYLAPLLPGHQPHYVVDLRDVVGVHLQLQQDLQHALAQGDSRFDHLLVDHHLVQPAFEAGDAAVFDELLADVDLAYASSYVVEVLGEVLHVVQLPAG